MNDNIPLVTSGGEGDLTRPTKAIYSRAQRNQRLSGMGTTLVVMADEREATYWVPSISETAGAIAIGKAGWNNSRWTTRW